MNVIESVCRGNVPLWKVYWIGHFAPSILLALFILLFEKSHAGLAWWIAPFLQTVILTYTVWISLGLWNCAANVSRRRYFWYGRAMAVIGFIMATVATEKTFLYEI